MIDTINAMIIFQCMEEFGVKNFVFSSSATVYGAPQYLPLDEKHQCREDTIASPYGKSKFMCEQILRDVIFAHPVRVHLNQ